MLRSVTLKGNPFALVGPELKVGECAPEVPVRKNLLESAWLLASTTTKVRLISVVPSLDTSVCELQTVRFHEEAAKLPNVAFVTLSADLPTAQKRFCGSKNINMDKFLLYSDHRDQAFGKAYGTLLPELGVECRALFVVDAKGIITFAQYVPEITEHPNYDAALDAAKAAG